MDPLISIIVPVYNVEKYLNRCIDSILVQTYKNLEIILINDGSTDNSPTICDEFEAKDFRIQVIHQLNAGLSSARNAGLDIAKGEFIGFVDSDDFIENDMYEKLLGACIENKVSISLCARYNYSEDGTSIPVFTLPKKELWTGKQAISNLLIYNNIDSSACDKLFHRKLFINVRFPVGKVSEDIYIIPKIICSNVLLIHIGAAKYFYYQRTGSISRTGFSLNRLDLLDAHKEVSDFVRLKYPDLHSKADSFYFRAFIFFYIDLLSIHASYEYYNLKQSTQDLARINFIPILRNRHIRLKTKIKFALTYLKIYSSLKKN